MADTGRQSPLAVNMMGSLLQNTGLTINPTTAGYIGSSTNNSTYTFGSLVSSTALNWLTLAINDGYNRGVPNGGTTLTVSTYNSLISIGAGVIPALGNSIPPTYVAIDPAGVWARTSSSSSVVSRAEKYGIKQGISGALPGPANAGYGTASATDQGQEATWYPYTGDNTVNVNTGITQWGWLRCHALQAWNEFNWNGDSPTSTPAYQDFCGSFMNNYSFMSDANKTINVVNNSNTFMNGVYSNMNDLISSELTGVSLSTVAFGTDLANLGKVIDLKQIETFGMPSNLLMNIGKAGAMTQDLSLVLLAAGLSNDDISSITRGTVPNWSVQQEQQILGAFLLITGDNLAHVLAPLQCVTQGLTTLADLLNLQMMFPNSYASLTVPVYNGTLGLPTNSKTYYPIYQNGGVNPTLDSPTIQSYVGSIIPKGTPPTFSSTVSPSNFNQLPMGFGSYLSGVIPADWATAAGAFSYSMRQINNIENVNVSVLAKVAQGIENVSDLPLVAGTTKPTDQTSLNNAQNIVSSGSGPAGSYTMSDFYGSMSGLPYPWKLMQQEITALQTTNLQNIYQGLLLATEWEQATVSVQYTTNPGPTYTVTGLTITNHGGGYGRGGAPAPTITISDGSTATCVIDTNPANAGSNESGTYGRVTSIVFGTAASPGSTIPTATIQAPPTSNAGGTNVAAGTAGWPTTMNSVVNYYIGLANTEISNIAANNPTVTQALNTNWNILGKQLAREQRSRYIAMTPTSVPKNHFLNAYPGTINSFLDMMPTFAQDTAPHMSSQTLEAISDTTNIGGQSTIAKLREERNQVRLQQAGIYPDNNIATVPTPTLMKTLMANGTVAGAISGSGIVSPNGNEYTLPAWTTTNTVPTGYYDPTGPGFQQTQSTAPGDLTPILNGSSNPVVGTIVPSGPVVTPPTSNIVIIAPPSEYNPNNLPTNLDPNYTGGTVTPSSLSIAAAIQHVVTQNCDCWVH